jgi:DNA-binding NtrC family response regulator
MARSRILVVEDEAGIRLGIRRFLEAKGYTVDTVETCRAAEEAFAANPPDAVLLDYRLGDGNGVELLVRLKKIQATVPMIILTAHGSIDLAVEAVKAGAEQFLTKPVDLKALEVMVERLLESEREKRRQQAGRSRRTREAMDPFLGGSTKIRDLAEEARSIVGSDSAVLIQGTTGAGKGVLARWLHENGPRADEVFMDLNCAGLSRDLLESELFGYEPGAFTGAVKAKPGLFEVAHKGTLFLDEIGDLDLAVQPRLLKALEDKRIRRLGDVRDRLVDIRLIAASHQDLAGLAAQGRFRSDLLFRINTVTLDVPALADRLEDVPVLAQALLARLAEEQGQRAALADDAVSALKEYAWPGNLRELRNVLERALLLSRGQAIERVHLRFPFAAPVAASTDAAGVLGTAPPLPTLEAMEQQHIRRALETERGHVERAARRLGISKSSLYQKIKKFGIDPSTTRR